jgi:hypothetical protein
MRYLCLIYSNESAEATMTREQGMQMLAEYDAFGEHAKASGNYVSGARLKPTNTATSIRIRAGKLSTTDGPFAETKEQLGGFYIIEAKDLNEAIQVGARIPGAKDGTVEVRPIWEM